MQRRVARQAQAHGRCVEQRIDNPVVQQVDFIHVQNMSVRRGQQAGFKAFLSVPDRMLLAYVNVK